VRDEGDDMSCVINWVLEQECMFGHFSVKALRWTGKIAGTTREHPMNNHRHREHPRMGVLLLANSFIERPREDIVAVATADCGAGGKD